MEIPEEAGASSPGGRVVLLTALGLLVVTGTVAFGRVFEENATTWKLLAAGLGARPGGGARAAPRAAGRRGEHRGAGARGCLARVSEDALVQPPLPRHVAALLRSLARVGRTAAAHTAPSPTLAPCSSPRWSRCGARPSPPTPWPPGPEARTWPSCRRSPSWPSPGWSCGTIPADLRDPVPRRLPRRAVRRRAVPGGPVGAAHGLARGAALRAVADGGLGAQREAGEPGRPRRGPLRTVGAARLLLQQPVRPSRGRRGRLGRLHRPDRRYQDPLLEQTGTELFTVRSERPSYWRIVGLEKFDGERWDSPDLFVDKGQAIHGGAIELRDVDPTLGPPVKQTYTFEGAVQAWLPAKYPARAIDTQGELIRYDPSTGTMVLPGNTFRDFAYSVTSYAYAPTPEELDAIPSLAGRYPARLTELPADTPQQIYDIANSVASLGGAKTPYRQILNIQNYLKTFTYSEETPSPTGPTPSSTSSPARGGGSASSSPAAWPCWCGPSAIRPGWRWATRRHPGPPGPVPVPRVGQAGPRMGRGAVPEVGVAALRADSREVQPGGGRVPDPRNAGRLCYRPTRQRGRHTGRRPPPQRRRATGRRLPVQRPSGPGVPGRLRPQADGRGHRPRSTRLARVAAVGGARPRPARPGHPGRQAGPATVARLARRVTAIASW